MRPNTPPKKIVIRRLVKRREEVRRSQSWKVAYADYVTAMMAFFLLLWLLNMASPEKRTALMEYFQSYSIFQAGASAGPMPKGEPVFPLVHQRVPAAPDFVRPAGERVRGFAEGRGLQGLVEVAPEDGGVRIEIIDADPGRPMFLLGSADPTPLCREVLATVYAELAPALASGAKVAVEGHTDAAPFRGGRITNWELAMGRANAVRRELQALGMPGSAIREVAGLADTRLLEPAEPRSPRNRRVSLVVLEKKDLTFNR